MQKNVLVLLVSAVALSIVFSSAVFASHYTVTVPPNTQVLAGDTVKIPVTISVTSSGDEVFTFSQPFAGPPANSWATLESNSVGLSGSGDISANIIVSPPTGAASGLYVYSVSVFNNGERVESTFNVKVVQKTTVAAVQGLQWSCATCKDDLTTSFYVENVGTNNINDVLVRITIGERIVEIPVGAMNVGDKTQQFDTQLNIKALAPNTYTAIIEVYADGTLVDSKPQEITIPVFEKVDVSQDISSTLWGKTTTITAENVGNVPVTKDINADIQQSFFSSLSYSEPPSSITGNFIWEKQLNPGDKTTVTYTEFYWPVPVILLLIIAAGIYSFIFFTSVNVEKNTAKRGDEWTVALRIRNRGDTLEGVFVRDVVPHPLQITSKFETLKPIARKTGLGTELIWRLGSMRKGEEIMLHYRASGKGAAMLPAATLRAKKGQKTILASSSGHKIDGTREPIRLQVQTE